jgi:heat shock protein HslJ
MKRRPIVVIVALSVALVAAACSSSGSSPSAAAAGLEGTWQWTSSTEAQPPSQANVPDPANYTITFNADGTFAGKADCNQIAGTYAVDGSNLTISVGPSTLAMCAEGSAGDIYVAYLGQVASYELSGSELKTTFADDAGTMTFTRA